MNRQLIATTSVAAFFVTALLVRPAWLKWKTGRWGVNGLSGPVGSAGWWGGASFIASMIATALALGLSAIPTPEVVAIAGLALLGAGMVLTVLAQSGMGTSWRIGVQETERTALVTTGLFAWVRNPIFTGMGAFLAGLALVWPNAASLIGFGAFVIGVQLQVRFVEEPWLIAQHGDAWRSWARRVGRFLPGVGLSASRAE
ncbi:MAG: isoprenylcysteine carboxylmethyltransferase family protein [Archangium sp.]|nr:isoprenylcysteine carboxylmethyltransferase family protein [Archangium sp.]